MTLTRDAAPALRKASALRDLCRRLPRVPTGVALERLRRFEALIGSPEVAGAADIEALAEGWQWWWREGETAKLAAMASRVPGDLTATNRLLATYATAAKLATKVDYDRGLYRAYRRGRALSADTGQLWTDAIAAYLDGARSGLTVLDLGAGTGRFTALLAEAFDARVVAVEPSAKMREEAERGSAHPRVVYRAGAAGAIPAADAVFDFAFLSMVIHHVDDVAACSRELHRVVTPGGLVFIRNVFSGRLDGVRYYEFFPTARAVDEARLPTVESVRDAFVRAGFGLVALDTLEQQIDPSLQAHYERIKQRALSTFALIPDAEFEEGLARMRRAVDLERTPTPVIERIDLLVLRRP